MKRALLASVGLFALALAAQPSVAADMPAGAPVMKAAVAAPMFNWSGWYVGAHAGGLWSEKEWRFVPDPSVGGSPDPDGFLGGFQTGFNFQSGAWVFGVEGDVSWSDASGRGGGPSVFIHSKIDLLATLTARIGYVPWERALVYAKGGVAWIDEDHWSTDGSAVTDVVKQTRTGWTLGGGLEYAFWDNWSAKVEYNYMDFGSKRIFLAEFNDRYDIDQRVHAVKLGINYRFATGKGPVVAGY